MLNSQLKQNTTSQLLASGAVLYIASESVVRSILAQPVAADAAVGAAISLLGVAGARLWRERGRLRSELELEGQSGAADDRYVPTDADLAAQALAAAERRTRELKRREDSNRAALRDQGKYGRRAHGSADTVLRDASLRDVDHLTTVDQSTGEHRVGFLRGFVPGGIADLSGQCQFEGSALDRLRAGLGRDPSAWPKATGPRMQNFPPRSPGLPSVGSITRTGHIVFSGGDRVDSKARAPSKETIARLQAGTAMSVGSEYVDAEQSAEYAKSLGVDLAHRIHDDVIVDLNNPPTPISDALQRLSSQLHASNQETSERLAQFDQAHYDQLCADDKQKREGLIAADERQAVQDRMAQACTLDGTPAQRLLWASSQAELDKAVAAAQARGDTLAAARQNLIDATDAVQARPQADTARHEAGSPDGGSGGSLTVEDFKPGPPVFDDTLARVTRAPTTDADIDEPTPDGPLPDEAAEGITNV